MCKCRIVITILLLIAIGASFGLPWVMVGTEDGTGAVIRGCKLGDLNIQKYTALGAGILSCLLLFFDCRFCRIVSLLAALAALGSVVCIYLHVESYGTFLYGFYIFGSALLLQFGSVLCRMLCKCEKCCEKKEKPA